MLGHDAKQERSCRNGEDCLDLVTCDAHCEHRQSSAQCLLHDQQHVCAHDFTSGPWIEMENGGTASCQCGLTAFSHSMMYMP